MAEFKDGSLWIKLAFLMCALGIVCCFFGFAIGLQGGTGYEAAEACFIIGFICFVVAFILILCLVFIDEVNGNKIALICFIVFALIAGLCMVIGVAMWGGNSGKYSGRVNTYAGCVACMSGFLGLLAGIFGILDVAGVKS